MWVVAGVNGAGKTIAEAILADVSFISADERTATLSPNLPAKSALRDGRMTLQEIDEALAVGKTFCWETTLSGRVHRHVVQIAKDSGYGIGLLYVGLRSAALARRVSGLERK